ncbi:hypothetical protein RI367_003558 [Sorochytrium milnesiophthora]
MSSQRRRFSLAIPPSTAPPSQQRAKRLSACAYVHMYNDIKHERTGLEDWARNFELVAQAAEDGANPPSQQPQQLRRPSLLDTEIEHASMDSHLFDAAIDPDLAAVMTTVSVKTPPPPSTTVTSSAAQRKLASANRPRPLSYYSVFSSATPSSPGLWTPQSSTGMSTHPTTSASLSTMSLPQLSDATIASSRRRTKSLSRALDGLPKRIRRATSTFLQSAALHNSNSDANNDTSSSPSPSPSDATSSSSSSSSSSSPSSSPTFPSRRSFRPYHHRRKRPETVVIPPLYDSPEQAFEAAYNRLCQTLNHVHPDRLRDLLIKADGNELLAINLHFTENRLRHATTILDIQEHQERKHAAAADDDDDPFTSKTSSWSSSLADASTGKPQRRHSQVASKLWSSIRRIIA